MEQAQSVLADFYKSLDALQAGLQPVAEAAVQPAPQPAATPIPPAPPRGLDLGRCLRPFATAQQQYDVTINGETFSVTVKEIT